MTSRHLLPLIGLLAGLSGLAGCSDEKKGDPVPMSKPAPATDPTRPADQKTEPPKPTTEKPSEKF